MLIGHRGAAGTTPENTVATFQQACTAGADYLEIDIQLSADSVPFAFHDRIPARTTNAAEVFPGREHDPITSFTWAQLQQFDAGSFFGEQFAGQRIPHLDDAARTVTSTTGVYLEIKAPLHSPGIERAIANSLATGEQWARLLESGKVTVLGFDETSNRRFAALAPHVPLQQLTHTIPDNATLQRWAETTTSVGTDYRALTAHDVERVKAAGLQLGVFTLNCPQSVQRMIDMGVDAITVNFPHQIDRYLRGRNPYPANSGIRIRRVVTVPSGGGLPCAVGQEVLLTNTGAATVDVSGYVLRNGAHRVFTVEKNCVLDPGDQLQIHTEPGLSTIGASYSDATAPVFNHGGAHLALWSNEDQLIDVFSLYTGTGQGHYPLATVDSCGRSPPVPDKPVTIDNTSDGLRQSTSVSDMHQVNLQPAPITSLAFPPVK